MSDILVIFVLLNIVWFVKYDAVFLYEVYYNSGESFPPNIYIESMTDYTKAINGLAVLVRICSEDFFFFPLCDCWFQISVVAQQNKAPRV